MSTGSKEKTAGPSQGMINSAISVGQRILEQGGDPQKTLLWLNLMSGANLVLNEAPKAVEPKPKAKVDKNSQEYKEVALLLGEEGAAEHFATIPQKEDPLAAEIFQGVSRLTSEGSDLLINKDDLYEKALEQARRVGAEAALDWVSEQVHGQGTVAQAFTDVVFGKNKERFEEFEKVFGAPGVETMFAAFGGKSGITAVKDFLTDVCRNDVKELKKLVEALG